MSKKNEKTVSVDIATEIGITSYLQLLMQLHDRKVITTKELREAFGYEDNVQEDGNSHA